MPEFIDLGIRNEPETSIEIKSEVGEQKPHFPCFYLTAKEPIDFGDAGTAEIRYKLIESTERNRQGKEEYRYELEVHGVKPLQAEESDDEEVPKKMAKKGLTQNLGSILEKVEARRGNGDY